MNELLEASLQPWVFECIDPDTQGNVKIIEIGEINSLINKLLDLNYTIKEFYIKLEE